MQKAASVWTLGPTSAEGWHTTVSLKEKKTGRSLDLLKRKVIFQYLSRFQKSAFDDVCRERFTV